MDTRITADIEYIDGPLAGLLIPAGYHVTTCDPSSARRTIAWLLGLARTGDFTRAVGTGSKYRVVGGISACSIQRAS